MRHWVPLLLSAGLCLSVTPGAADDDGAGSLAGVAVAFGILDASGHAATRFAPGEIVTFRLELANATATAIRTTYTAPGYDIAVYGPGRGALLWQAHADMAFIQLVQDYVIPPRETKRMEHTWDLRDADGRLLAPGLYEVRASVNIGQRGALDPLLLTIQ